MHTQTNGLTNDGHNAMTIARWPLASGAKNKSRPWKQSGNYGVILTLACLERLVLFSLIHCKFVHVSLLNERRFCVYLQQYSYLYSSDLHDGTFSNENKLGTCNFCILYCLQIVSCNETGCPKHILV